MKFKSIILSIIISLFVIQTANVLHADDAATKILGKVQELAEKQKIKGKNLKEFITNNVITVDYEGEERAYKFNTDITYEIYVGTKIVEKGTWSIKGLTKNSVKLTGHQDLYIQFYKDKERISTLANLKKKNDLQTNRKILKISSSSDFKNQLAQIELEKQKAIKQKKKEEEEKRLAELKAEEEKKQQEEEKKRIAEEEKSIAEEEKRIAEEEKRLAEETKKLEKHKKEKLAELESYQKSNSQLLEKAHEINLLLISLKNDKEGEKIIAEYNSKFIEAFKKIENIPASDTEQIEAFKIDTKIHLALEEYVKKHENNISSYQAQLQEAKLKAEQEARAAEEKKIAEEKAAEEKRIAEEKKKKAEFFKSYAGIIDGYQDAKFGMNVVQVDTAIKNCKLHESISDGALAGGWMGGSNEHIRAIKSLMGFYSLYFGESCYQILSNYPDLYFGFDEHDLLNSVATMSLLKVELANSRQNDQLKEIVKKIEEKYTRWYPPGTTSDDWNSWVNEFNARNTDYILYAFEEGQVMLSIGYGGFKAIGYESFPTTFVTQMLYFSKNNQEAKDFYTQQLNVYAGTSSGKGL